MIVTTIKIVCLIASKTLSKLVCVRVCLRAPLVVKSNVGDETDSNGGNDKRTLLLLFTDPFWFRFRYATKQVLLFFLFANLALENLEKIIKKYVSTYGSIVMIMIMPRRWMGWKATTTTRVTTTNQKSSKKRRK